ncbi:MAG: HNH endonuclease [Pseudonocardiaceae bacterium]
MIFYDRGGFLFRKRWFFTATGCPPARLLKFNDQEHVRWQRAQANQPVRITSHGPRTWWWFDGEFYWDSAGYDADDVRALVRDRQRREQARLDRARMLLRVDEQQQGNDTGTETRQRRGPIPRELARAVYERDGGRCVQCDARFDLQYDHIIPVALGGATTLENLQLLCGDCNRTKGANI